MSKSAFYKTKEILSPRTIYALIIVAYLAILVLPTLNAINRVSALSDTTPMELVDFYMVDDAVNVSNGVGYAEIAGEIYEDLSGFESIYYLYVSPSGQQTVEGDANSDPEFISENVLFPQHSEPGIWRLTLTLTDVATNVSVLAPDDLVNLGFNGDVAVTSSTPDLVAPSVTSVSFDSTSVDTSTADEILGVTLGLSDNLTGVSTNRSYVTFTSSTGQKASAGIIDAGGGVYQSSVPFKQFSEEGDWTMELSLTDEVGNTQLYDNSDLANLSLPSTVLVIGNGDTTPVTIDELRFNAAFPPGGDQIANSAKVTVYGRFSDNLSGVSTTNLRYLSQTSNQIAQSVLYFDGVNYQFTVYIPPYAAQGEWLPELTTSDLAGNVQVLDVNDITNLGYQLSLIVGASEEGDVVAGGTISTDTQSTGATTTEPFQASVTSPIAGTISITEVELTNPETANEFQVFNREYDIKAPTASIENPLVLVFTVDTGSLEGQTAQTVEVFRNGFLVEDCTVPGITDPDPCVTERTTLNGGDVQLTVLTSEASIWFLGYTTPVDSYAFGSFSKPIKRAPQLNEVKAGSAVPVKFTLQSDSNEGLDVLGANVATSQLIDCTTFDLLGDPTDINLTNNAGLSINANNIYRFNWKTQKSWDDTCRQLVLEFDNGEVETSYYKF